METSVTRAGRESFGGSKSGEGMLFPVVSVLGNEDLDKGGELGEGRSLLVVSVLDNTTGCAVAG